MKKSNSRWTYAGHPNIIAMHERTVHPFPYPSLLNMAGANRGNPKPASDRRHAVAASAINWKCYIKRKILRKIVTYLKQHAM